MTVFRQLGRCGCLYRLILSICQELIMIPVQYSAGRRRIDEEEN